MNWHGWEHLSVISGIIGSSAFVVVGYVILGVTVTVSILYMGHRSTKNGSKRKTHDKHTKPRSGRLTEKKRLMPGWRQYRKNKWGEMYGRKRFVTKSDMQFVLW